jgi:2-polyprenyl-6-hydroxyphenyl methylase / 3-demethylubiquinone-9 3-methyltransferase
MSPRTSRERELAHDRLTARFDELMDDYDLGRRAHVLVEQFLGSVDIRGARVLDGGCGVGGLTRVLTAKGARVVALDIGPQLTAATRQRCGCSAVVGTLTALGFSSGTFDVVVSSEAIEHTADPERAVSELYRVLKPGGYLVLSTPNRLWQGPVRIASAIGWRPYDGYENFLWPGELRRILERQGGRVIDHRGIHLWPFQITRLRRLSTSVDRFGRRLLTLMINQCISCLKPAAQSEPT